jgi:hypothetical protein
MVRKRPARAPKPAKPNPEQLVFPFFDLRVGDVVLEEDGGRAEVVGRPTNASNGKTTRSWLRREGETVQREAVWEAWRRVRVVRRAAA